jgi:hypothetical protein
MKKTTDGGNSFGCAGQQAGSIRPDLLSLMQRIQASIGFGELAMATAALDDEEVVEGQFILDDVTPRHAMANAALKACRAALAEALCHFLEAETSGVLPREGMKAASGRSYYHA